MESTKTTVKQIIFANVGISPWRGRDILLIKLISRLLEYLMIQSVKGGVSYENIGNIFKFLT